MNKSIKLGLVSLAFLSNSQVINAAMSGAYFGGGIGSAQLAPEAGIIKVEDNVLGGRAFIGYNFNDYLGLEANYSNFGKTQYTGFYNYLLTADYTLDAFSLVGKVYLPFSKEGAANLYVLVGGAYLGGNLDLMYQTMNLGHFTTNALVPTAGAGVSYDFNQHLTANFEISAFGEKEAFNDLGIPQSTLATIGLAYKL